MTKTSTMAAFASSRVCDGDTALLISSECRPCSGCRGLPLKPPNWSWGSAARAVGLVVVAVASAGTGAVSAPSPPDLEQLGATRERPLFAPTRRKPPNAPAATPTAATSILQTPNLQVSGIVVGPDRSIAIVRRSSDPRPVSLEVGGEIDGWVLKAIRPREIEVQRGARSVTMRLTAR